MSPLEGVAALRPLDKLGDLTPVGEPVEPQGPWDLWLAEESEGEASPFQKYNTRYTIVQTYINVRNKKHPAI